MPALTKSSVGSSAGISEELFTRVWPRSSKKRKNRWRISLLVMKLFYFLSYGVFLVSETGQGAKKTARITLLQRRAQFPIDHCSFQCLLKRGEGRVGKNLFHKAGRN